VQDLLDQVASRLSLQQVQRYWFAGGHPEPWLNPSEAFRDLWQRNFIDSYLLRDIGVLFPGLQRARFRQFVNLLGQHSGNTPRGNITSDVRDWWINSTIAPFFRQSATGRLPFGAMV